MMRLRSLYEMFFYMASTIIIASLLVAACNKNDSRAKPTNPIVFQSPPGFPAPVYNFSENPLTEEGFELGRKLFHDNRLSSHLDVTCGSCHQQQAAYTTFDHDLGHGTNHQHTRRNVPVIFNMAWHSEFEWDGRVKSLNEQMAACLTAPEKMGEQLSTVAQKLSNDTAYTRMFADAFGDRNISDERITKSLAQFVVMIVSSDSKYDRVKKGEAAFNTSEAAGYELFKTNCASCHSEPLFTDLSFSDNGIGANPFHEDDGRQEVTGNPADSLKFKVPTLRNVMLTGYFAHDGRYIAVGQLLDHYMENGIPLSPLEKFYLEEFLFTLSDSTLVSNPRFE